MKKSAIMAFMFLSLLCPASVIAISDEDLQSVRSAVIEMCRGGTLAGSAAHTEARTRKNVVTLRQFSKDKSDVDILLTTDDWNGIQALINNPAQYSECVQYTLSILVPALEIKQNFDKDLNARVKYIKSPVFCERLGHVISQAPYEFREWRNKPGTMPGDEFPLKIGPYVMGNPEALGMIQMKDWPDADAQIMILNDDSKNIYFHEVLVLTGRFGANAQAGLVFNQVTRAIDECCRSESIALDENVAYRGGEYLLLNDTTVWWQFYYTAVPFWKSWKTISVFLYNLEFTDNANGDHEIYITVHSPIKKVD